MSEFKELTRILLEFRTARNWGQFHQPKDLAISLSLEANEVLEHMQWKNGEELDIYLKTHKEDIGDELADVLAYLLQLAHDLNIDMPEALRKKIEKNAIKYPVEKSRGNATKYNGL